MPENETLPKTKKSADWLAYADKKLKAFQDYHSETNMFGQTKNPRPLEDDYSKLLSNNELQARKMGMDLLRKERSEENAKTMQSYRKGGEVSKTGPAKLHAGEKVVRKPSRKKTRSGSR
jgi:hypothetical protein